jgi:hypothetical protein
MTKIKAATKRAALILRSGHLAAPRRMAACTLVAILRDAKSALLRMRTPRSLVGFQKK